VATFSLPAFDAIVSDLAVGAASVPTVPAAIAGAAISDVASNAAEIVLNMVLSCFDRAARRMRGLLIVDENTTATALNSS
jgi:hypothetical protein